MKTLRGSLTDHWAEVTASLGLLFLYLAVMSGHFLSIDGLVMWRQAIAMTYHQSWSFVPPIWWGGYITSSGRGVGASLQYVPGLLMFPWLSGHIPVQPAAQYDYKLFYGDILYIVAGAPVWAVITAATAYLVGLIIRALGFERHQALWAMAFYGVGSPALAASRGDWPQPIVAICWAAGVYACLRYKSSGARRWLWVMAAAVVYGVLTRPLEGSLLLPGVVLLLFPAWRQRPIVAMGQAGAWAGAVGATLLLNWARFGAPLNFGYNLGTPQASWTTPIWLGLPNALLSPGRGVCWEFPALALSVLGTIRLWKGNRRLEALTLTGVPLLLFLEACQFTDWVGGWDWGFRFFEPGLPLVAALAAIGAMQLPSATRRWLAASMLAGGLIWNVPAIATDILGGYGGTYAASAANWNLSAFPPLGAWRFLLHVLPTGGTDGSSIDIVWFRAVRYFGKAALVPFALLLVASATLWTVALRSETPSTSEAGGETATA